MLEKYLKNKFLELNEGKPSDLVEGIWTSVYSSYMESHRYYHTLEHLYNLFNQVEQVKHQVMNMPVVAMAIFYHDAVYQPGSGLNEEKSAAMAEEDLRKLGWKERDIREVAAYIRSTKTHTADASVLNKNDLLLFLDLDLTILGSDWDTYRTYSKNILHELGNNATVKWGRKGFMQKFLQQPQIYHTAYFKNRYEANARQNIEREIDELLK